MTPHHQERGAASLMVLAVAGLLLFLGAALAVVAAIVVDHRRAQSAADLAALAAAGNLTAPGGPCASAATLAQRNGAELVECAVDGHEVTVRTRVAGPTWLVKFSVLEGQARAGPAR